MNHHRLLINLLVTGPFTNAAFDLRKALHEKTVGMSQSIYIEQLTIPSADTRSISLMAQIDHAVLTIAVDLLLTAMIECVEGHAGRVTAQAIVMM